MKQRFRILSLLFALVPAVASSRVPNAFSTDNREIRVPEIARSSTQDQTRSARQAEIVLQAGITSPQTQIVFSPDGTLLASTGVNGNSIKLWEVASGRVLRQIETGVPSVGTSFGARPYQFSRDGKSLVVLSEGRVRRWDIETGAELQALSLSGAKSLQGAVISDDAGILAGSSYDNSAIHLWNATDGRELRQFSMESHQNLATQNSFALSPDGKLLAVFVDSTKISRSGPPETSTEIVLWDVAGGRKTDTLKVATRRTAYGAALPLGSLAFSSDGGWLGLRDETSMRIWETQSGREIKSLTPPALYPPSGVEKHFQMFVTRFLFSPDRRLVSFVAEGQKLNLVDAATGSLSKTIAGHNGFIVGVCFSPNGRIIATSGGDNQIKIWDVGSGNELKTFSGVAMPVYDVAFTPDGRTLVVSGQESINSWELRNDGVRRAVSLPPDYAKSTQNGIQERGAALSRDGRFVIAGSSSQASAKVWDVSTGRELSTLPLNQGKELAAAAFDATGANIALTEKDQPSATNNPMQRPSGQISPPQMVMPDMTKVMEQMRKDPKKMQEQMKKIQEAMKNGDLSAGITFLENMGVTTPNKTAAPANSLRVLDIASGRQIQSYSQPSGFMGQLTSNTVMSSSAVSFSRDGRMLASTTGFNAPIVLRDVATGQELRTLRPKLSMGVHALAWSPDGRQFASAQWGFKRNIADPTVAQDFTLDDITFQTTIWDVQTGAELNSLSGHRNFINALAFSADGAMLASGSFDSTVKLWDAKTGRELRTLQGHSGSVSSLEFSRDGRFLVSGSDDGSARLWNVRTGELAATLVSLNRGDDWLVVTPDGSFDGSPGGWNQILWRFSSRLLDVSPVEIFFNEYYHPGLLSDVLTGKKITVADISQKDRRQPTLNLEVSNGSSTAGASRELNVKINVADAPAGAQDVRLFRNGLLVKVWRGDVLKGQTSASLSATIKIVAGPNRITAYAFNHENVKSSDAVVSVTGAPELKKPATLHLIVMGVNEYANPDFNLKYATADARAFAEEVRRQQQKLGAFANIEVTSLLDREATKANLLGALHRLAGMEAGSESSGAINQIKPAQPEDAVVVYYAGHGTAEDQRFYLIPHDLGYTGGRVALDEAGLRLILNHGISDLELEQAFQGIDAGHLLMVIDACNSGQALEAEEKRRGPMNSKGLAQLAYEKGMYILTAAQSYQAAMEAEQLGHGYLTYALVEEGLKSSAADNQPKDGMVVIREWLDYATDRVPRMQESKIKEGRGLKHQITFVEGEENLDDSDKRNVQRPRVFYRREFEPQPLVVARP